MMPLPTSSASAVPAYDLSVSSLLSESWRRMRFHRKTLIALGAIAVILSMLVMAVGQSGRPSGLNSVLEDLARREQQFRSPSRSVPGQIDIPQIPDLDGKTTSPRPSMEQSALANLLNLLLALVSFGVLSGSIYALSKGSSLVPFDEAARWGLKRILPVAGMAFLLLLIFLAIFAVPFALIVGAAIGGFIAVTQGASMSALSGLLGAGFLTSIVAFVIAVFFIIRLAFVLPLAALAQERPFGRSWELTRGRFFMVFGRLIVASLLSGVCALVAGAVLGPFLLMSGVSIVASVALQALKYGIFLFGFAFIVVLLQALLREEKGVA